MITKGYTLDLYCDRYTSAVLGCNGHDYGEFPHQFFDELGSRCRAAARKAGWKVNYKTGSAICPKCAALGFRPSADGDGDPETSRAFE